MSHIEIAYLLSLGRTSTLLVELPLCWYNVDSIIIFFLICEKKYNQVIFFFVTLHRDEKASMALFPTD